MARKNKKNLKKIIIIVSIILVILVALLIVLVNKNSSSEAQTEKAKINYSNKKEQEKLQDLYEKSESQRMETYCADFFKLIDDDNYGEAYKLLYSDYKENYFPTLENFKRYFEDYFPKDFGLSYTNIERLGDIYVLTVNVKDTVNGSYGHSFDMYVVIKETKLNEYVISFSRNSAVEEE